VSRSLCQVSRPSAFVVLAVTWAAACSPGGDDLRDDSAVVTSSELVALSDGTVHILPAVKAGAVVAYASWAEHRIYIDHEFRDRIQNILNAHISVSTGHWRIPLPGDSPTEPLTPGAPEREFEEFSLVGFAPPDEPTLGDFRIVRAGYVQVHIELQCLGAEDESQFYRGSPIDVLAGNGDLPAVVREDFQQVGSVDGFSDPTCAGPARSVAALMWTAPRDR
jgi:hypothetical protein